MDKAVEEKREEILKIADKYGVTRVSVFGSRARGDSSPNSDVDFLIEVDNSPRAPWFPGGLVSKNSAGYVAGTSGTCGIYPASIVRTQGKMP
jgi:hypothetical protein